MAQLAGIVLRPLAAALAAVEPVPFIIDPPIIGPLLWELGRA